ncbi:MAG TPA: DUF3168 domain-containing protein [Symbiobacteriaceae bacterium]|nr:DUF3168 domain-containing protein [Symbiobacteriaceae bacterium]
MVEQALIAYVRGQPAVSALVGDRVVMLAAAEHIGRPLIVLYRTGTRAVSAKTGLTGDVRVEWEFHCVADDPATMDDLGVAVHRAMSRMPGDPEISVDMGTNEPMAGFSHAVVTNQRDAYAAEARLYVRIIEGYLWYSEAV